MPYFAEIDNDNMVIRCVSISDADCVDENGNESESVGISFCTNLFGTSKWVQTFDSGDKRRRFAGPGMVYSPELDAFLPPKPYPWYLANEKGEWERPWYMNDATGQPFAEDELKYIFYYIRNTKSYRFCPAVLKDPSDKFLSIACTSNDFMYPTFEGLIYRSNRTQEIAKAKIDGEKIVIPFIHTLRKEVDITPIGIVLEVRWEGLNPEIAAGSLNAHPQTASRTRQELFRLIIEWAYCHTEFGNDEIAATTCHDILRLVQMPLEVRNELLEKIEGQAVERYIRGLDPFKCTSFDVLEDPPSPPLFTDWYNELRGKYPPINGSEVSLNVDPFTLPETYPM